MLSDAKWIWLDESAHADGISAHGGYCVAEISKAYRLDLCDELKKLCADLCMECGCCAYVCPAKRHIVQTNKLAKAKLNKYLKENKEDKK